jgi:dTDP-4-dehydrorhamnose reductase
MRILLLGQNGQLGWELHRTLQPLGEVISLDYPDVDMADARSIREIVRQSTPEVILNATAYTDVDKAESEPDLAEAINGIGPGVLSEEAKKLKAVLIHYSTDYVFDGKKGSPYIETDVPNPLNVYGHSKLNGEQAIQQVGGVYLIFRTSWVYSLRGNSFMNKVLAWARTQETLRIVDDQIGSPTWARLLAEATSQVIAQGRNDPVGYIHEKSGLYHLAGNGSVSRFEWAKKILKMDRKQLELRTKKVLPALTSDFPSLAQRPKYTALDCLKFSTAFGFNLPNWEVALFWAMSKPENIVSSLNFHPGETNGF